MRIFGWIYIIAFGVDAFFSWIASMAPSWETFSNMISTPLSFVSFAVFILCCIGELKPRVVFFLLSGYYMMSFLFGIVLMVLVMIRYPGELQATDISLAFYREEFAWFGGVLNILLVIMLSLSVLALILYSTYKPAPVLDEEGFVTPPPPPPTPVPPPPGPGAGS